MLFDRKVRVAINGFGRIGRAFFRLALKDRGVEVVAINDLGDPENLAYLLSRDSVYGAFGVPVAFDGERLVVGRKKIPFFSAKDPRELPWKKLKVGVALEATGVFETYEKAQAHLIAGASRVVMSAPAKDEPPQGVSGATVLMGINEAKARTADITSNASCTTNAGSPLMAILGEELGVEAALLSTVHGYTATQAIVDAPSGKKDMRRGRAAAVNIVPSSTGAAGATAKALPHLRDRFDGIALRVPVLCGSLVDITFIAKRKTNAEEVNSILERAAGEARWRGIFTTTREPLVSSDIIGNTHASIADLGLTRVVGGTLVKVCAWYDNEMGYASTLLRHVKEAGRHG